MPPHALLITLVCHAGPVDGGPGLVELAKAWEAAQLFHPAVMHREVGLDEAFVRGVKALDQATTDEARRAAVALVLAPLQDSSSTVVRESQPDPQPAVTLDGGVAWVHGRSEGLAALAMPGALEEALGDAQRVVVDLRGVTATSLPVMGVMMSATREVSLPAVQTIAHLGYSDMGQFSSRLEVAASSPTHAMPDPYHRAWAVLLEAGDLVPLWVLALRASGQAVFVSHAALGDEVSLDFVTVSLGGGWAARVRTSEYVAPADVATDILVPRGADLAGAAMLALRKPLVRVRPKPTAPTPPLRTFSLDGVGSAFPDREHRLLGALRVWLASKRFWGYPELRSVEPDEALMRLFTAVAKATTPETYADALRVGAVELLPDSHATVLPTDPDARVWPPFELHEVEGHWLVARSADAALKPGDEVLELDGVPLENLIAARLPLTPVSRPALRRHQAVTTLLYGPSRKRSVAVLPTAGGARRTVELEWSQQNIGFFMAPKAGPHFRTLPNGLGFIDLVELPPDEVDVALEGLKGTRGLVVDMRGYPKMGAFSLGPRLGPTARVPGVARMCVPVVRATQWGSDRACELTVQQLAPSPGSRYAGPVVMLIDERAVSQSEHSGLILESYTDVTFVGSGTAGANGNVAAILLPGGLMVSYTGLAAQHRDGRDLQGVGLVPDVVARPTLAGIRAGKDEVLEAGVRALEAKLKKPAR